MNILVDFYCDNNLGDDLMGEALLDFLAARGHRCYVLEQDEFVSPEFLEKKRITKIRKISKKEIEHYSLEVYIKIGGSMFPHGTFKEGILRYFELNQIRLLKREKIRICIINCNVGPVRKRVGIWATKKIFKLADFITCRDEETYKFISGKKENKFCYPDIVFGFEEPDMLFEKQDYIGISIYTGYASYLKQSNFKFTAFVSQFINLYHKQKKEQRFILFAFDTGYNSDLPAVYKILKNIKDKSRVEIVAYTSNKLEFLKRFRECKTIIGTRFHSIVLALKYGIPVYPVIYSNKSENLLKTFNFKGECTNITECDNTSLSQMIDCVDKERLLVMENNKYIEQSKSHFIRLGNFLENL